MPSSAFTPVRLPDADTLRAALRQVADPEIGASIIDLGLVYDLQVTPEGVVVDLTLTSPACPMGGLIVEDARAELVRRLPAGMAVEIRVVWDPPWSPARMTPECRARLGWTD